MDFKRESGKFPEFPAEEEWKLHGFKFGQATPSSAESGLSATESAEKGGKSTSDSKGDSKKEAKGKKPDSGKGGKKGAKDIEPEPEPVFLNTNSNYFRTVDAKNAIYMQDWRHKNESENFSQKHEVEIIKTDKRREVDTEMKDELFALLKEELENLKNAIEKDSKKKKKDGGNWNQVHILRCSSLAFLIY
jgi:hypothetical protein